jgi:TetR/AcrR family transcriptional regulator, cholesterol catabolism regulator
VKVPSPGLRGQRKLKQPTKRDLIVASASELFSTRGYVASSMEDVALATRLSKGAIYHYFTGKDEILYAICSEYVGFDVENLAQELKGIPGGLEKVRYIISRHVNHYTSHAHAARTLLNEAYNLPPKHFKKVKETERRYYRIVADVLSKFLGPRVGKEEVTVLAFNLFGMCNWIFSWYNPKGRVSPDRLAELIFDVFTGGISGIQKMSKSAGTVQPHSE